MKVKKEVSFLTLMLMIMYTIIFNKYSTIVLVALYLPFMVLLLLPKWRLVIYGLLSFFFLVFVMALGAAATAALGVVATAVMRGWLAIRNGKSTNFFRHTTAFQM